MDSEPSLDALVASLREDVTSGAAAIAGRAAAVVARGARALPAGSAEELRTGLAALTRHVLDAQPAMAPLVTLAREVLLAAEAATDLDAVREEAAGAAASFSSRLRSEADAVARSARPLLAGRRRVATVSSSGTVRAALVLARDAGTLRVLCFESRPLNEGRALAASLAGHGIEVRYAVDAAVHALVPECDLALLGADSIGDAGVVNKIGSAALVAAARAASVPVYVLADRSKLLPTGWPQRPDDDRPRTEVWDAPSGIDVWNRYFEAVPIEALSGVVTEVGVSDAAEVERLRASLPVPAALSDLRSAPS